MASNGHSICVCVFVHLTRLEGSELIFGEVRAVDARLLDCHGTPQVVRTSEDEVHTPLLTDRAVATVFPSGLRYDHECSKAGETDKSQHQSAIKH